MSVNTVVVHGLVRADGTLEVPGKLTVAPGPVEVTVRAVSTTPARGDWWDSLQQLRTEHAARGHRPRSAEEIDAEVNAARDEWEEHQLGIERLQEECRKARRESTPPPESAG